MPKTFKQLNTELDAKWDASTVRWDRLTARLRVITTLGIVLCLITIAVAGSVLIAGTD